MKLTPQKRQELASATIVHSLGLILACSAICALTALGAPPAWWSSRGAIHAPQVVTNSGVVTTNYVSNEYAVVTQGQLKQFTARAVDELNANLPGGAGTNLTGLTAGWSNDYVTNGYNAGNIKPSDYTTITVGQLKYVGKKVWSQLVAGSYTNALPSWLDTNAADTQLANIGQLKTVFNFDLSVLPEAWQIEYFGHTGVDPSAVDPNGLTNLQSYRFGLDPTSYNPFDTNGISYVWEVENCGAIGIDPDGNPSGDGYSSIIKYYHGVGINDIPTPDIIVDASGGGDYTSIQTAINYASDYYIILVKPGTYLGPANNVYSNSLLIKSSNGAAVTFIKSTRASLDTTFDGFTVSGTNGGSVGVAHCYEDCTLRLVNCVFCDNIGSTILGVGDGSSLIVKNCSVFDNTLSFGGHTVNSANGIVILQNTILWNGGNEIGTDTVTGLPSASATYCDIQGTATFSGLGNINADPLLFPDGHLSPSSPAIGTGTGVGAPNRDMDNEIRPYHGGYDIGADQYVDSADNGIADWWQQKYFGGIISADLVAPNGATAIEDITYQIDPTSIDIDLNGIPYAWENEYFGQIRIDASADPNGDGFSNYMSYVLGINPLTNYSLDTDGDGIPDYLDSYPTDATRWLNLANDPSDHTAPTIELDVPTYAILVP